MALTIDELNIQIAADSKNASRALTSLIKKLEKLKDTLNGTGVSNITITNSFNKTTNAINKTAAATEKHEKATKSSTKSTKSFTDRLAQNISKWRTLYSVFQNAANTMSEWFTSSNDYVETLNLFNVTMGEGADAAKKFADSVSEAMGIDVAEWMSYQGTFKQLTSGFGIVEDKANTMSKNLTQLSYDLASFFNTDVETAFDKLSSAMAGQVKGLREFGIDTTVASLQEYALAQGIDKSVRSMTQAEKSMLRYNYIMENSIKIQGDMARTIATPANSIRILTALLAQMKRALGNIVSVIVVKFIPYVQAMVELITDAANAIANFLGYELPKIDYSGLGSGFSDEFEDAEESIGGVSDGIKAIKKQLMGFDELNIISNPDTSSSGSGSGEGAGGPLDMKPIEYNFLEGLKTDKLDEIKEKLKKAAGWAATIGTAIAGWKLGTFLADLAFAGTTAKGLKESLLLIGKKFTATVGITLAVTGITIEITEMIESFKEGLDGESFWKMLGGGGLTVGGATMFGASLGNALLGGGVGAIIAGIPLAVAGIYDAIVNGLNWLNGVLIPLGTTLIGGGIGAIVGGAVGSIGGPLGIAIGAAIGVAVGLLTDFGIWLWQNFDSIEEWFNGLPLIGQMAVSGLIAAFTAFAAPIMAIPLTIAYVIAAIKTEGFGIIAWVKDHIITPIGKAATWIYTTVLAPIFESIGKVFAYAKEKYTEIKDGLVTAFTAIFSKIKEIYLKIKEIFVALWGAFKEYVWNPIADRVTQFYDDKIKPVVDKVKGAFTKIWEWFKQTVYDKIVAQVDKMKERIEGMGKKVVDGIAGAFKGVMNNLFWQIELFLNTFIRGLNGAIGIINKIPGVEISTVSELSIPRLAEGGIVDAGQMFIAREAGPELVGSIGNKTAVANNDQIISGIEAGVYRAMMAANSGNRGGTQTIRIVNEIDGAVVGEKVIQYHNGKVIQTGVSPLMV